MKTIAERQAEGIDPIVVKSGNANRQLLDDLTAQARDSVCDDCLSDVWPAWTGETYEMRCLEGFSPNLIEQKNQIPRREGKAMLEKRPDELAEVYHPGPGVLAPIVLAPQAPMTIDQFKERQELVKYVVSEMVDGIHYGQIPGTSDKSLWEPGAEYLRAAFNIQWDYDIVQEKEDFKTHYYYYRYRVFQLLGPGVHGPGWEVSGSSKERKFFCKRSCPNPCDQDHLPLGMEAAMLPHNVRDRVLKRGFVAMIRNVTGTTGYFKQALDVGSDDKSDEGPDDPNLHPWLKDCPIHKVPWRKTDSMRQTAHAPQDGETQWCNRSDALKSRFEAELKKLTDTAWDMKDVNALLKENFNKTWSALDSPTKVDALRLLNSTVPPGSDSVKEEAPQESEGESPENQGSLDGFEPPQDH